MSGACLVVALTLGLIAATPSPAATPSEGRVSKDQRSTSWTGPEWHSSTDSCTGPSDPSCDHFLLTVETEPEAIEEYVAVEISASMGLLQPSPNQFDVEVFDPEGRLVGETYRYDGLLSSISSSTLVVVTDPQAGIYEIRVRPESIVVPAPYHGRAYYSSWLRPPPPPANELEWKRSYEQASAEVPLNVVMVGFEPGEIDEAKLTAQVPESQRPGVLFEGGTNQNSTGCEPGVPLYYGCTGLETLINHGREYFNGYPDSLLPISFKWKPRVTYAPHSFTDGLFKDMMARSHIGKHSRSAEDEFLDRYNSARGIARGLDRQVPLGSPTRFINAEDSERWIEENAASLLGFPVTKDPGKPGYTVFFLNTFDSKEADAHFPKNEFHHFHIDRHDPDTEEFHGIDWGRVWGGNTRSLMIDLGAAPNSYEAESWGNRGRSVLGSATYDPPLWEYRAGLPRPVSTKDVAGRMVSAVTPSARWDMNQLANDLGRNVVEATSYSFFRSYLYPPRPLLNSYHLSATIWHDRNAKTPFASNLRALYDQNEVAEGLNTLVPYLSFGGDTIYNDLDDPAFDQDQSALDGFKIAGGGAYLDVDAAMDYVDDDRSRFYRGSSCSTTIPVLNVVVEKHFAWSLPLLVLGIAPSKDGRPWGSLASVNDFTKWSGADENPTMAMIHPQLYKNGMTYTTVHEVSHYLGLSHPHDTIGASRNPEGKTEYWWGFTWMFNSTAAPTTYSHSEMRYNVLDQESIARGHAFYYLAWSDGALYQARYPFETRGITKVADLPAEAAQARQEAIDSRAAAQRAFSEFRFIDASVLSRRAWAAAARYLDMARELPLGTTQIAAGTSAAGC